MDSGKYLNLEEVIERSWPAGPLFRVSYVESGKTKLCTYNFQAFCSGLLRDIEVAEHLAVEIESMTSVLQVELEKKALAERDRKAAEDARPRWSEMLRQAALTERDRKVAETEALAGLTIEERHALFLRKMGRTNHGVQAANSTKVKRVTHCYSCRNQLDSQVDIECSACQWILCTCGACGCGWTPKAFS